MLVIQMALRSRGSSAADRNSANGRTVAQLDRIVAIQQNRPAFSRKSLKRGALGVAASSAPVERDRSAGPPRRGSDIADYSCATNSVELRVAEG
jgi:hypothetical protein